ncbi:MAG: TonB-dependent receptor [Haliea sp.]|nr:TonB-dependent receptor [Haliea sp.]
MLRAAVGVEYMQEDVKKRKGETTVGDLSDMPFSKANRDVKSVFGELSIPVLDTLDLSISARYDDYRISVIPATPTTAFPGVRLTG